jgi:hypothetical protein
LLSQFAQPAQETVGTRIEARPWHPSLKFEGATGLV